MSDALDIIVHPDALWSVASIARWCDYTVSAVKHDIITQDGFPKPRRYAINGKPRWVAGEVMAFFGVIPGASSPALSPNPESRTSGS